MIKVKRMRNNVKLTDLVPSKKDESKTYAFGLVLDGAHEPNFVFFPPRIVRLYGLTEQDVGTVFDCVFRDDPRRQITKQDPVVMTIIAEGETLQDSIDIDADGGDEDDDTLPLPNFISA